MDHQADFRERLAAALKWRTKTTGKSTQVLCDDMGFQRSTLTRIAGSAAAPWSLKIGPRLYTIRRIAQLLGACPAWLAFGVGLPPWDREDQALGSFSVAMATGP